MCNLETYENFIHEFKIKQSVLFNKLTILGIDLSKKHKVFIKDNYGVRSCNFYALIRGRSPTITEANDLIITLKTNY